MQRSRMYLKLNIRAQYGTQRAFATKCRRSDSWISSYVTARRAPNQHNVELITGMLSMPIDDPQLFLVQTIEQLEFNYGGTYETDPRETGICENEKCQEF